MKKLLKRIKNSSSGLSLVEMLCAIMILLIVSEGMAQGISLAQRQYEKSIVSSQSKVLCSSISTIVERELAYTTEIKMSDSTNVYSFLSSNYVIRDEDLSHFFTDQTDGEYGQIYLGTEEEAKEILGSKAYNRGLTALIRDLRYDQSTYTFTVTVSIGYKGEEYMKRTFNVINVNKTIATIR